LASGGAGAAVDAAVQLLLLRVLWTLLATKTLHALSRKIEYAKKRCLLVLLFLQAIMIRDSKSPILPMTAGMGGAVASRRRQQWRFDQQHATCHYTRLLQASMACYHLPILEQTTPG